jgi:hypothetical protein
MLTQTMMELCGRLQMSQACESDDVDDRKEEGEGGGPKCENILGCLGAPEAGKSSFPLLAARNRILPTNMTL